MSRSAMRTNAKSTSTWPCSRSRPGGPTGRLRSITSARDRQPAGLADVRQRIVLNSHLLLRRQPELLIRHAIHPVEQRRDEGHVQRELVVGMDLELDIPEPIGLLLPGIRD